MLSYLALYRKYRPISFEDFVGQSEVASIIKNEILNNRISHAYLFSGPRGTGKTSTAKIIARMINCNNLSSDGVPCGICESCVNFNGNSDIVEIDAASNNGVDEIRELRDKVNLVPTCGKYKIYIIDEVHMLTTQAFNALLKTLEEPPAHIIFILATTEFHKIPITVVSRCQKFQFLKFSIEDIVERLKIISNKESIEIDEDILFEIARLSDGGLRDAINMLDQLISYKDIAITVDDVYRLNGVISYKEFRTFLEAVYENDVAFLLGFIENIDKLGRNYERFIVDLIILLKDILVYKNTSEFDFDVKEKQSCVSFLSSLYDYEVVYKLIILLNDISVRLKNSSFAKVLLITEFIKFSGDIQKGKLALDERKKEKDSELVNCNNDMKTKIKIQSINYGVTQKPKKVFSEKLKKIRINNTFFSASKVNKEKFMVKWGAVLEKSSSVVDYISIAGMLSDIDVLVVGDENVVFLAQYDSLLERLISNFELVEKLLYDVFEISYKVVFLLKDEWEFEKNKYITNLKSAYKYSYIFEDDDNNDEISETDDDVLKIEAILGADIIKYE